jgi:hypothetical protein
LVSPWCSRFLAHVLNALQEQRKKPADLDAVALPVPGESSLVRSSSSAPVKARAAIGMFSNRASFPDAALDGCVPPPVNFLTNYCRGFGQSVVSGRCGIEPQKIGSKPRRIAAQLISAHLDGYIATLMALMKRQPFV